MQVFDDRFQAESGWNAQCRMCSKKLLMMGREDARNM
jgi:DNA-directed RNA polymerase subunit RPC12/RpoP